MVFPAPASVTVTLCDASTPAANALDVVGLIVPAVVLRLAVPVNPVTVLLLASCAVIVMLNGVPAVCVPMLPPPAASTRNFANTPGFTLNALLVPVSLPLVRVAVIVFPVPACVTVTLCVRTPLVNAADVVGVIDPAVVLRFTVPVKLVAVLLFASWAVSVMLKAVPAVCGLLIVPMTK